MENIKNESFNFMEDSEDDNDFDDYNKLNITSDIKKDQENKKIYKPGIIGFKLKEDLINLFQNIINIIEGMEFKQIFENDFQKICENNLKNFENLKKEKILEIKDIGIVKINSEDLKNEILNLKKKFSNGLEKNFLIMKNLIDNIDDINSYLQSLILNENRNIKEKIKKQKLGIYKKKK